MSTEPYLSEIDIFAFNVIPKNWAACNGQTMQINQNQALFALIGTTYGGNGVSTFSLPNLQGRVPVGTGQAMDGNNFTWGQTGGEETHALLQSEMPQHLHFLQADATTAASSNVNTPAANLVMGQATGLTSGGQSFTLNLYGNGANLTPAAPASIASMGSGQAHENRQPFLALNLCICINGLFPARN